MLTAECPAMLIVRGTQRCCIKRERVFERLAIEWRWAFRNLRTRGWRAVLAVALLAVALGANAVLFAVADSLVFRRVPYPDADRLVEIQVRGPRSGPGGSPFLTPALLDEWRKQNDLFTGVEGYLTKTLFLTGGARPESVGVSDVTVGLFELLGVRPRWGRPFAPGDEQQIAVQPVLIAETLALERFGNPAAAVGQRIATSGENLIVIGVMPATFRFPEGTQRIWRALDPRGPLARGFAGVSSIARVRPDSSATVVAQRMEARSDAIAEAAGARRPYAAMPGPLRATLAASAHRGLFLVLLGASACLLLMACANIASLELATAVRRARLYAIQLAIGATRSSLARVTVLEGLILVTAAAAAATVLAHWATAIVAQELPVRIANSGANPIDVDLRVIAFMSLAAVVATLLSSAPIVVFASRAKAIGPAETGRPWRRGFRPRRVLPSGPDGFADGRLGDSAGHQRDLPAQLCRFARARQRVRQRGTGQREPLDPPAVVFLRGRQARAGARGRRPASGPSGCARRSSGDTSARHGGGVWCGPDRDPRASANRGTGPHASRNSTSNLDISKRRAFLCSPDVISCRGNRRRT